MKEKKKSRDFFSPLFEGDEAVARVVKERELVTPLFRPLPACILLSCRECAMKNERSLQFAAEELNAGRREAGSEYNGHAREAFREKVEQEEEEEVVQNARASRSLLCEKTAKKGRSFSTHRN